MSQGPVVACPVFGESPTVMTSKNIPMAERCFRSMFITKPFLWMSFAPFGVVAIADFEQIDVE
jgi:hypothetical protein